MVKNNIKKFRNIFWLGAGASILFFTSSAYAFSPLIFSSSVNVSISSPSAMMTIATGSVADSFTVNATSVSVGISAGEGNFTISSPSYDLLVTTSSANSLIATDCAKGIVTATLSQSVGSATYTIAPSGVTCSSVSAPIISNIVPGTITDTTALIAWTTNIAADSTVLYGTTASYGATSTDAALLTSHSILLSGLSPSTSYHFIVISAGNGTSTISADQMFTTNPTVVISGGGGSSGGGGGGGGGTGYYIPPIVTTSSTTAGSGSTATSTIISSSSSDQDLIAEIAVLEAELRTLLKKVAEMNPSQFTRNLTLGSQGKDVQELQHYLNIHGSFVRLSGSGSLGQETQYFGISTEAALAAYQESAGITPAVGYFGPITRAYVNTR